MNFVRFRIQLESADKHYGDLLLKVSPRIAHQINLHKEDSYYQLPCHLL